MDLEESHSSSKWWIITLHIQIFELHMCIVPGPASQVAVFKRIYALPGLQCIPQRLTAHIDSVLRRHCSFLQYIGTVKYAKASETLLHLQEINTA